MPSISCRWSSVNDCADTGGAISIVAATNEAKSAGRQFRKTNSIMGLSFSRSLSQWILTGVLVEGDNVVGPDPTGRPDRKSRLGPRREFARGLVVAARKGRLRRGQIGICEIVFAAER